MSTNPRNSQFGGASSPNRGTGLYTGRVTLIYNDGRVRVFINTFGRNIGPCRIINKSAGDAISLNDEVLCTYANDTSDELIVIGRLTERTDPVSESTSGLVVEATTASELVRITQKGTGAALLVEDSTNPDSTPFIIDASGNVGVGTLTPSTKVDISGSTLISGDLTVDTTTLKVDSTNNRVGIGTASPSVALDISGSTAISGDLTVDTTTLKVDSTNNRVGIGTASPLVALDVIGEVIARVATTQDGVRLVGRAGGTGYYDVALTPTTLSADRTLTLPNVSGTVITTGNLSDITSTGTLTSLTITGDLTVDTNTLKLDSTNNRVGINTTSPATALDVTGTITARVATTQDGVALAGRAGGTSTYEVTLTPTTLSADRTLTLPDTTGTVVTTGDSGTVTSTMILDGTIVNGDINASAAIADTKLATISTAGKVSNSATTATSSNTVSTIVARDASGNFTAGAVTATSFNIDSTHYLYAVGGDYGSIQVTGDKNAWAGYSVNGNAVFMSNGTSFGLYDDTNNQWFMYKNFNGDSRFYYAGTERILIKSDGVSIRGDSSGTGVNGTLNAYAYYGNSNVDGTGNASFHPSGIYSTGTMWLYGTANWAGNTQAGVGHGQPAANNTYYWGLGVFNVNAWSYVGSYNFYNPSDERYKQNIATLGLGLNFMRLLNPVEYTYLYPQFDEEHGNVPISIDEGTRYRAGLTAQNVKAALSELGEKDFNFWSLVNVQDPENSPQVLDYTGLIGPVIQAIKELDAKVTSLMERIEALESK